MEGRQGLSADPRSPRLRPSRTQINFVCRRGAQVWEAAMKKAKAMQQHQGRSGADSGASGSEKCLP